MNHDKAHCTGEAYGITCRKRDTCHRYALHLDTVFVPNGRFCYLFHTGVITDGCTEFIENK